MLLVLTKNNIYVTTKLLNMQSSIKLSQDCITKYRVSASVFVLHRLHGNTSVVELGQT